MKIHKQAENRFVFFCPGCECAHGFKLPDWYWNNDSVSPTISPIILSVGEIRCHSFVTNGQIQFLPDCGHKLAGQTVDIPEWESIFPNESQNGQT